MIKKLCHCYSMGSIRLWRWLLKEIDITEAINSDPVESMNGFLLGDTEDKGVNFSSPFIPSRLETTMRRWSP
jgi:hypothetical protein